MFTETPEECEASVVQDARTMPNSDVVKLLIVKYYPDN
jgi:hypothetical protein